MIIKTTKRCDRFVLGEKEIAIILNEQEADKLVSVLDKFYVNDIPVNRPLLEFAHLLQLNVELAVEKIKNLVGI